MEFKNNLRYPIQPRDPTKMEKLALKSKITFGYCLICGRPTIFHSWNENLRDSGYCLWCKSHCRRRQLAALLLTVLSEAHNLNVSSVVSIPKNCQISTYSTEANGALYESMRHIERFVTSEYLGKDYLPGQVEKNVRHEDLMSLSFMDESLDIILTSEVFEHIPLPYKAHQEIFRVLKKGGRHLFTVPFHQTQYFDEHFAKVNIDEKTGMPREIEFVKPVIRHIDPIRPEGIPVYTIFSLEMLLKLCEIGFDTRMYQLYDPWRGILGMNAVLFEAVKSI